MTAALTGLVLAGGASTRMGRDKATIVVDGERLVDRAVRRLGACCTQVLLAPGSARPLEVSGARSIPDAPGEGPLAGIVAALQVAPTELVAVVAVDMPHVNADVLRALAACWDSEPGVAPRVNGVVQPLHAVYATAWVDSFAALLRGGERSPRRALQILGARIAGPDVWAAQDPTGRFVVNLNAAEDLTRP
jgi:molybdopterin-guanine dinucleotide biosynthesis protein A